MPDFAQNLEQARMAWRYYAKNDRTIAFDPASQIWIYVGGGPTAPGDDAGPGGLSSRALERIASWQDAVRRGAVSHDAAEIEIIKIIREES
ncbi:MULTISPECIES: hypothetical protein [unclassified Streptomyces]|uniref:hypothetical protein n=1 Tax=unclassified Streptomyces TaxID=2593676 RepID=UPI00364A3D67